MFQHRGLDLLKSFLFLLGPVALPCRRQAVCLIGRAGGLERRAEFSAGETRHGIFLINPRHSQTAGTTVFWSAQVKRRGPKMPVSRLVTRLLPGRRLQVQTTDQACSFPWMTGVSPVPKDVSPAVRARLLPSLLSTPGIPPGLHKSCRLTQLPQSGGRVWSRKGRRCDRSSMQRAALPGTASLLRPGRRAALATLPKTAPACCAPPHRKQRFF